MAAGLIRHGSKDVSAAGTAVRLSDTSKLVCEVVIRAKLDNVGDIYIGDSTVDSTGYPLQAGEPFRIADLAFTRLSPIRNDQFIDLTDIWIDADQNGDGVHFAYIDRG